MNINRDYLIINDVKKSNIKLDNGSMFFYITDKNTQNIFVNLVINISNNDLIQKYANIENAEDYTLTMNIVKPSNTYKVVEGKLHDKEKAIFEFNLNEDCCDEIGTYRCELLTKCTINDREEITTSNKLTYKVKSSVLNDLDDIVEAPEYPLVIQLFDKLSDIEQYEEDRRANELARQLAEEQRQTRFDALDTDMVDSIQQMDDKVVEVENRITAKEQAVDKLINDTKADIDEYKVAKDQEIDEYKSAKDTEINNAITNQDNKIDTAISNQNDRIAVIENNDTTQNNRLDTLENRATQHESRLTNVEAKNTEQDGRLDIVENKNQQQDNRLDIIEAKNVEQDNRLNEIEAIDVVQNTRLDAIEIKNQQQDDRLLDIEKVNKRQDMNLKCLFAESKNNMIDVTEEGNSIYLQNSTVGYALIDEIQGQTLVNCNKEPDKELILNGNINTSGDNAVTITEGVDGGLVDVALEGNTLVNVSKTKDSTALPLEEELTYLYANTQYTVQFMSDKATTADITLGGTQLLSQSIVAGLNRINITTPATLTDNKLIIDGVGANISQVVVTDTNREFRYFEGMKSVGECEGNEIEIEIQNKNLFNKNKLKNGTFVTFNGKECYKYYDSNNVNYQYVDNFKKNTSYTYTLKAYRDEQFNNDTYGYKVEFHYTDGTKDTTILTPNTTHSVTSNGNKTLSYISGAWHYSKNIYIELSTVQIEEGSTGTAYISHQSNTQQLTHEPLRAVGDVKDRYVLIDGKWYIEKNTKKVIINNNTLIQDSELEGQETCKKILVDSEVFSDRYVCNAPDSSVICATLPTLIQSERTKEVEFVSPDEWNVNIYFSIKRSKLLGDTLEDIKTYLQQNPITVVYRLATPVYEPIDYNPLEVHSNVTHISSNSAIPCNMTIKNHGYNCLLKPSTTYTISSNLGLNTVTTGADIGDSYLRFMDTDTSDVTSMRDVLVLEGDWTSKADLVPSNFSGIESTFEQEYDAEKGKYKVNVKVANEDKTKENNIAFYINEPLRGVGTARDRVFIKDDKVVVQRNCGIRPYEDGDFDTYPTDKVDTVYPLVEPTYEEVEYNDTKLFIESFKNSTLFYNSNVPVTSTVHYSYSVPIVDTVAQTANVTDQQDSMIIDLATQVAVMEMMLM